jgi:uncharacterized protein YecT (DUF1311 family)
MATPTGTKVDAERARLRAEGYTEAEISRILMNQASGNESQRPAGAARVQGNVGRILGNATAAVSYARGAIFGIRGDIGNIFNRTAPPLERAKSGGFLALKAAIVAVICFAIYQAWQQHITYQTETTKANAPKAQAESCTARMQAYTNIPLEELQRGKVDDRLLRDCDPTYAAREAQCDARSKAIVADLDHLTAADHEGVDRVMKQITAFKEDCRITEERQRLLKEAAGRAEALFQQGSEQPKATNDDAARAAMTASLPKVAAEQIPTPTPSIEPSPTPTSLRTPTAFNCAKQHLGADFVICASPELMDAEARLEDAYQAARAAKGDDVKTEQWAWIKNFGPHCGLPLRGRPASNQIQGAAGCVRDAMEQRIRELQAR